MRLNETGWTVVKPFVRTRRQRAPKVPLVPSVEGILHGPETFAQAVDAELQRWYGITLDDTGLDDRHMADAILHGDTPAQVATAHGDEYGLFRYTEDGKACMGCWSNPCTCR